MTIRCSPAARGGGFLKTMSSGTISEMARMRSDFAETVRAGGADGLIAILEKKINELKAGA